MSKHYPVEQRERAVKMVLDHLDGYRSVYAACRRSARKSGVAQSRCAAGCCRLRLARPSGRAPRAPSSSGSRHLSEKCEISRRPTRFWALYGPRKMTAHLRLTTCGWAQRQ